MPLNSSLSIGSSALMASQLAIQVAGNNLANATTPGYSRQTANLISLRPERFGSSFLGRGVRVETIMRQVDPALQARLWAGISNEASARNDHNLLSAVESTLNELSDADLSSELSAFFNSWSELANSPGDPAARSLVVEQGRGLASYMRSMRQDLTGLRNSVDAQLGAAAVRADHLLTELASINTSIVVSEAGTSVANDLRDRRDQIIAELSELVDVSVHEQADGSINVLVGSTPAVLGGVTRGLELDIRSVGDDLEATVRLRSDGTVLPVAGGTVGALLRQRTELVSDTIDRLDSVAAQLVYQVNRIHSTGYGTTPMASAAGTRPLAPADTVRALNDPANGSLAGLPFAATNGGFFVTVRNEATGAMQTVRVDVDLDGLDGAGQPGFADDTSAADIRDALDGVDNLTATLNPDGTLNIRAAAGYSFTFSEDTSGALAVLGVNAYFTGSSAEDIGVSATLAANPQRLSTGRMVGGDPSDNGAALAVSLLQDAGVAELDGKSIRTAWQDAVQSIAVRTHAAATRSDAASLVRANLEAQRSAVSGVSVDEESINLLNYQRQYQGAARFISVIDELTQTLLQLI